MTRDATIERADCPMDRMDNRDPENSNFSDLRRSVTSVKVVKSLRPFVERMQY
jgi:hypothetical protein